MGLGSGDVDLVECSCVQLVVIINRSRKEKRYVYNCLVVRISTIGGKRWDLNLYTYIETSK